MRDSDGPKVLHTYLELFRFCAYILRESLYVNRDTSRLQFLAMGTAGQTTAQATCARKQQLIECLRGAMDDIVALSTRELEAAIANDQDLLNLIKNRLEKARQHKDSLLVEYHGHLKSHGC